MRLQPAVSAKPLTEFPRKGCVEVSHGNRLKRHAMNQPNNYPQPQCDRYHFLFFLQKPLRIDYLAVSFPRSPSTDAFSASQRFNNKLLRFLNKSIQTALVKFLDLTFFFFLNLRRAGAMLNKIQHPTIHRAFSAVIPVAAEYYHLYGLTFEPMHYLMAQPSS